MNTFTLHHGSDDKPITKFDKPTFFFIDSPDIASSYGLTVYECTGSFKNVLELVEGDDLERNGPNGFRISGTSQTTAKLITELMTGASDDVISDAMAAYKKHGIGAVSPARIFRDEWNIVADNLKRLGYDAMWMRDESMMGASGGVFPAMFVVDVSSVDIRRVYVFDDYGGEPEETYTPDEWVSKNSTNRNFVELVESFSLHDPRLIRTILEAHAAVFEATETGTMTFWHGGNLDRYDDVIAQKSGRYEFGPGLYATTQYEVVQKYTKGGRKLYKIEVERGTDIQNVNLSMASVTEFVNTYVPKSKRKDVLSRYSKYIKNDSLPAMIFMNVILNEKAIPSTYTSYLRQFLVDSGIDYELVQNAFGWGESMIVLYNMKKLKSAKQITSKDKITEFDLPTVL